MMRSQTHTPPGDGESPTPFTVLHPSPARALISILVVSFIA